MNKRRLARLRNSIKHCEDCGSIMKLSNVGGDYYYKCLADPFHKKRYVKKYKQNKTDCMDHRMAGSFGSGKR